MKILKLILFLLVISLMNCKEVDKDKIEVRRDILTSQLWGYPEIVDGSTFGVELFLNTPTEFKYDGTVIIANYYNDYWEFIDENSIRFINNSFTWYFLSINDSVLHVNILKSVNSEDFFECIYRPL